MNEPTPTVALQFRTFKTYYEYELTLPDAGVAGAAAVISYLPELPCFSCGTQGMIFVRCNCALCGNEHSGAYCAESYTERGEGTALTIAPDVFVCRACDLFNDMAQRLSDRATRMHDYPLGFRDGDGELH